MSRVYDHVTCLWEHRKRESAVLHTKVLLFLLKCFLGFIQVFNSGLIR